VSCPRTRRSSAGRRIAAALLAAAFLAAGCGRTSGTGEPGDGGASAPGSGGALSGAVRLAPDPAVAASVIETILDAREIDVASCTFTWKRNGVPVKGASGRSLAPSHFSKGDRVSVEVSIPDSSGGPARLLSDDVTVENMPPKVTAANLFLSSASGTPILEARVQSADADGDRVAYAFHWFRNESPLENVTGEHLPVTELSRGDLVQVEVVATDTESESAPVRSNVFHLENLPPRVTSRPPAPRPSQADYRYQVTAEDPDGDPVTFSLSAAPQGMAVDPAGLVTWTLPAPERRRGDHIVKVSVSDGKGGAATHEFTLHFD
jgi:hypothetical protein